MLEQLLPRTILMSNGKRISLDALLPFAIVPLFSIIGAVSFYLTLAVFLTVGALLQYLRCALPNIMPRTQFFFMWLLASVLYILLIFHTIVITKLEILPEEHFALVVLIIVSTYCLYDVQRKAKDTFKPFYVVLEGPDPVEHNGFMNGGSSMPEAFEELDESSHCGICIGDVRGQLFHSLWLDCCITNSSYTSFAVGTLIGICAFFYGANLMLTSICQPFIAFGSFLLPENCNNVYMYFDFSTCFFAGTYSVLIGVLLAIFMFMQFLENVRRPSVFKA